MCNKSDFSANLPGFLNKNCMWRVTRKAFNYFFFLMQVFSAAFTNTETKKPRIQSFQRSISPYSSVAPACFAPPYQFSHYGKQQIEKMSISLPRANCICVLTQKFPSVFFCLFFFFKVLAIFSLCFRYLKSLRIITSKYSHMFSLTMPSHMSSYPQNSYQQPVMNKDLSYAAFWQLICQTLIAHLAQTIRSCLYKTQKGSSSVLYLQDRILGKSC